jgi:hypothetical protein
MTQLQDVLQVKHAHVINSIRVNPYVVFVLHSTIRIVNKILDDLVAEC